MPRSDHRLAGLFATLCRFLLRASSPRVFFTVCCGLRPLTLSLAHASARGHARFVSSFACVSVSSRALVIGQP